MQLVDTHTHIDDAEFDPDRAEALERARSAGVSRQLVAGIDAAGWPRLRDVCSAASGLFPAYGLHPLFLGRHRPEHLDELRQWIEREHPLALGECGLDYWVEDLDRREQARYFRAQLEIAADTGLPVIVHARRAVEDVILTLRGFDGLRGVVHSFSGSRQQAEQLWERGFLLGIGGPVTYARAKRLRRLVADMPIEYLLLETDSPDQPDCRHQGRRNEPARLLNVLEAIAELRDEPPATIAAATTANAGRLFNLPPAEGFSTTDHTDGHG